jgi:hypothetical protein
MHTLMLTTALRRQCKVTANPTPTVELFVGDTVVWELQDTDLLVVEHDGPTTCIPRVSRIQTRVGVDPTGRHSYVPHAAFALPRTSPYVLRLLYLVHPLCCICSALYIPVYAAFALPRTSLVLRLLCVVHPRVCCVCSTSYIHCVAFALPCTFLVLRLLCLANVCSVLTLCSRTCGVLIVHARSCVRTRDH